MDTRLNRDSGHGPDTSACNNALSLLPVDGSRAMFLRQAEDIFMTADIFRGLFVNRSTNTVLAVSACAAATAAATAQTMTTSPSSPGPADEPFWNRVADLDRLETALKTITIS